MDEGKKRWLVKDKEGRVRGPFFTDDILQRISRGEFIGDEQISIYPGAEWIPISKKADFYDHLLAVLEKEDASIVTHHHSKPDQYAKPEPSSSASGSTKTPQPTVKEKTVKEKPVVNRAERVGSAKLHSGIVPEDRVIELKPKQQVLRSAKIKKTALPFFLALTTLLSVGVYFLFERGAHADKIHLLSPRKNQSPLSEDQVKSKIQNAMIQYTSDLYSGYLRAQSELVQIIEGDQKNIGAMALLCLTYLELWPFAYQDSTDLQAISTVTQLAGQVDPAGLDASTCRTVDLLVRGRSIEARSVTEAVLDTYKAESQPPVAFYYFKAHLLAQNKEYSGALGYSQYAQPLWPAWLRVAVLEAKMYVLLGQPQNAANKYRQILKLNQNHKGALIELGVIELKHLKNYEEGERLLNQAFRSKEKVENSVEAGGLLALATMTLQRGDGSQALKLAERAYALDPFNEEIKNLIVSVGGAKKLEKIRIVDSQYMYEGDQLVREGNCAAAQALYKSAFEANPKNGLAAIKAAECLWQTSLTTESIEWLNNAIKADPKLIDAYIILADYFTQRYNYDSAARVLSKARSEFSESYKVFRGMALFELRRNNLQGAIGYADRAIRYYEADVESYVIKAKAQIGMGDIANALTTSTKAVEIDVNNRDGQIIYAKAVARARGVHVGIDYLMRLVNLYPTISEYRLALGELYVDDQRYTEAQAVFEQIVRIEDKPKKALIELGKTLQVQQRYDEALQTFFRAAEMDPADVDPLFRAGILYLDVQKPAEAKQQFLRVQRINKSYPLIYFYLGRAALLMDASEEALEQANLEKQNNPKLADPYLLAAEAHAALGQFGQCAGEYQKAVQLRKSDAGIYVKMARCYRQSGNLDAAVAMINQASGQDSGNPDVWKEQGAVYETKGDKVKAIEAYNQYLILAPNALDRAQIEVRIKALSY